MRKLKNYLTAIIFCFLAFSCQQESIEYSNDNNPNLITSNQTNKLPNQLNLSKADNFNKGPIIVNELETRLQWVSYITATVLYFEEDARTDFFNTVNNRGALHLEELLGNNSFSTFKTKFLYYLYLYSSPEYKQGNPFNLCPDSEKLPPWPPFSDSTGGDTPIPKPRVVIDPIQDAVDGFMNYILNENCIELYFPNQLLPYSQESFRVTSTAHPLTNSLENEAFLRYRQGEFYCITVEEIIMSPVNVIHPSFNTIVARPYRDASMNDNCSYSQYPNIDFTDFLRI